MRCDGTAYLVYSLRDLPRGTGAWSMAMVLLTMGVFLGTTDRGELYLLPYIDLNTRGILKVL